MLEFFKWVFSDFWIWLGFVILIAAFGNAIGNIIKR